MQRKPPACSEDPTTVAHVGKRSTACVATELVVPAKEVSPGARLLLNSPHVQDDLGSFDRYRVLGILGEGGMGVVFHALDPMANRQIALKVMVPTGQDNAELKTRFLREARAMAAIQHDNVVPVLHVDEAQLAADTVPYLVMPLLEGQTLAARLAEGPLSVSEAMRIARGIARGLAAAHKRGLIHRDIKPSNVWLMKETDDVKILDFGLARELHSVEGSRTQTGAVLGTPMYMAPEQADGLPADEQSDVYSLGVVLYEMVTGIQAFRGPSVASIMKRVVDHVPTPSAAINPAVGKELSDLIDQLLAKQPAQRPASALAVAEKLDAIDKAEVPPPGDAVPHRRAAAVRGGTAAVGSLVAGCAFITAAAWWLAGGANTVADSSTAATDSATVPGTVPNAVRGFIDVRVWPDKATFESGIPGKWLADDGVLPLEAGDFMHVEVEIMPEPAYLYVVWLESDGDAVPIYPWLDQDWGQLPPHAARSSLQLPGELGASPSGMETLLLLVRHRPLTTVGSRQLAELLRGLPEQKGVPSRDIRIWMENGRTTSDRGAIQISTMGGNLVVNEITRRLRSLELRALFQYTRAVSFSFQGE